MANNIALEAKDLDLLKQLYSQMSRQAAGLLATVLSHKVALGVSELSALSLTEISLRYPQAQVILKVNVTSDTQGQMIFVFPFNLCSTLCSVLAGGGVKTLPSSQLSADQLNTFSQLMGQFLNFLAVSLQQATGKKINMTVSELKVSAVNNEINAFSAAIGASEAVLISSKFALEGLIEENISQILPVSLAKDFILFFKEKLSKVGKTIEPLSVGNLNKSEKIVPQTDLGKLLINIPLQLNVELGRTKMTIKEILELGPGSIVEVDRLAGEPVDIVLNNKAVAKGEVVVIDDNLGVRITNIVQQNERI